MTFLTDNLKLPGAKIGTESKAAGITAKPKAKEAGNAKTVEGHATHRQMTKKERRLAKKAKKKAAPKKKASKPAAKKSGKDLKQKKSSFPRK